MTGRQRAMFKKMLGAPFDLTKLGAAETPGVDGVATARWESGNGEERAECRQGSPTAVKTAGNDDTDDVAPGESATSSAPPKKAAAAAAKRKSLRELRGAPSDDN